MSSRSLVLVFAVLFSSACQDAPRESNSNSEPSAFEILAKPLSVIFEDSGFSCSERGRELYPLYYECVDDTEIRAYLYANDRNQLEGLRVFAPLAAGYEILLDLAETVLSETDLARLQRELADGEANAFEFQSSHSIVEWVVESDGAILRISAPGARQ